MGRAPLTFLLSEDCGESCGLGLAGRKNVHIKVFMNMTRRIPSVSCFSTEELLTNESQALQTGGCMLIIARLKYLLQKHVQSCLNISLISPPELSFNKWASHFYPNS